MDKNESTKQALASIIFYRFYALTIEGVPEPEKIISSEIHESLRGAGIQTDLITMETSVGHPVAEDIEDCIKLLLGMQREGKADNETFDIVIGILSALKEISVQVSYTLKAYKERRNHGQKEESGTGRT